MPLTRLLLLGLLALPLPAFAQNHAPATALSADAGPAWDNGLTTAGSEPWRIVFGSASDTTASPAPLSSRSTFPLAGDAAKNSILEVSPQDPTASATSIGPSVYPAPSDSPDSTCYAIRSYVMARDEKNSDSTHLVRYSTCQAASRYQLRTADVEIKSSAR
jgi:hypothetical protein